MTIVDRALEFAARAHRAQLRKGTDIPYIAHPCGVALLLAQADCDAEVIAAGLLHDTVEDTGTSLTILRERFGERVAAIVAGCSEPDKERPWEDRKAHTIAYLKTAPEEVRWVSCADKLHNVRALAADYAALGEQIWQRFKRGKAEQAWYYRALVASLCAPYAGQEEPPLFRQLREEVQALFGA